MNRSSVTSPGGGQGAPGSAAQPSRERGGGVASEAVRRILVPVDLAHRSEILMDYALRLAARSGGKVWLLHVIEAPSFLNGLEDIPLAKPDHQVQREIEEELKTLARCAHGQLPAVDVLVRQGGVAEEICAAAREIEADLIVMRNPRRDGWRRLIPFRVAERVMKRAPCPVLTLRQRFLTKKDRGGGQGEVERPCVLVPVEFSANCVGRLRYGLNLARASGAELTLLHVVRPPLPALRTSPDTSRAARTRLLEDARHRLTRWVAEQTPTPVAPRVIVRFGDKPEEVIERFAGFMNADLVVAGLTKVSWWRQMRRGGVARKLVRRVTSPLLCWNDEVASQGEAHRAFRLPRMGLPHPRWA